MANLRMLAVLAIAGAAYGSDLAREIFKELIEYNTSYSTGSTTEAAQAVAKRMRAAGFAESDIFVGGASPKKANVVVRLRGTAAKKPLLLLAHLDVVEARREDWSMDPFRFIEKDGYFYGRGTSDDKAQAAIWVANMIRYKQQGWKPERDLILALTADEEGGGPYNGVKWLLKNRRDLIDSEYCINEGGWGELVGGKPLTNNVQVAEKYIVNFRLEIRNKGGHSSMPVADNAIYRLSAALGRLSQFAFPLKTNEVTAAYFERVSTLEADPRMKSDLAKVAQGDQQAMTRVAAASPVWNATLRTTCVATQLEGGHARNALPQLAAANVNCRVMPEDTLDYVTATLKRVFADETLEMTIDGTVEKGPMSALRPEVMDAVTKLTTKMWPGVKTVPIMVVGGTDGLYLRGAGIPTYGVQGIFMERDDFRAHGRDERLLVKSFFEGEQFLDALVRELAK